MAKKSLQIVDFSGGLNCYRDARDIEDNQFAQQWNATAYQTGVIKVGGGVTQSIRGLPHDNSNFQQGYGLFAFSPDSMTSIIDGDFNNAYEEGTLQSYASGTPSVTLAANSTHVLKSLHETNDHYNNYTIFIYSGDGAGQTRRITDYVGSTRIATISSTFNVAPSSNSKYKIFKWVGDESSFGCAAADYTAAGYVNYIDNAGSSSISNDDINSYSTDESGYFLRTIGIPGGDNQSADLGHITFNPKTTASDFSSDSTDIGNLSLTSGVQYRLSFLCKTSNVYKNNVSDTPHGERVPFVQLYSNTAAPQLAGTTAGLHLFQSDSKPVFIKGTDATFNYADDVTKNYVNNGDFEDGTATGGNAHSHGGSNANDPPSNWSGYDDAGTTLTTSYEQTNEYGGEGNTLDIESASFDWKSSSDGQVPTDFIFQELTLPDNQWYELMLAYSSESHGANFCILDAGGASADLNDTGVNVNYGSGYAASTGSVTVAVDDGAATAALFVNRPIFDRDRNFIGVCTARNSDTEIVFGGGIQHALVDDDDLYYGNYITTWGDGYLPDTGGVTTYRLIGQTSRNNLPKPHKFFVPKSATPGNDRKILLCFAPNYTTKNVRFDGITVKKSYPDLLSMSNTSLNQSANPYASGNNWSKYYFDFTIPSDYTDVSDWVLNLNAGSWGRQDGASGTATSHKVYFAKIKLEQINTSSDMLLLNDNTTSNSKICMYSYESENWTIQDIIFSGINMKPVYTYINGMLKISDANFKSGNTSKLVYYADNTNMGNSIGKGFKVYDSPLSAPPPLLVSVNTNKQEVDTYFDALYYANKYTFNNIDAGDGSATSFKQWYDVGGTPTSTDWPAGDLGGAGSEVTNAQSTGRIIHYNQDDDSGDDSGMKEYQIFQPGTETQIQNAPWGNAGDDVGKFTNPFYIPWAGQDGTDNDMGGKLNGITTAGPSRVEIEFDYDFVAAFKGNANDHDDVSDSNYLKDGNYPTFTIEIGKLSLNPFSGGAPDLATKRNIVMGVAPFVGATKRKEAIIYFGNQENEWQNEETSSTHWENSDEWPWDDSFIKNVSGGQTNEDLIKNRQRFKAIVHFEKDEIALTDNMVMKFKVNHATWKDNDNDTVDMPHCIAYNQNNSEPHFDFARKERVVFSQINVFFWNNAFDPETDGLTSSQSNRTRVNFNFSTPTGQTAVGWEERVFKTGVSSVNIFDEESNISSSDILTGGTTSTGSGTSNSSITSGQCPDIDIFVGYQVAKDEFRKKLKYYMKDTESDIWYLQFYIDLEQNKAFTTTSNYSIAGNPDEYNQCYSYSIPKSKMLNYNEVDSYESQTLISQDIAEKSIKEFYCDYKTATVTNSRLYVGNVRQNGKVYSDRMIKSQIGKYNLLPSTNFIDVAINDGDEIIFLESFKDKLLQFKNKKVFIINTSGDYEFLEETYEDVGIAHQCQVAKTPYGIAWVNKNGCYLYDGSELTNLIDNKIPANEEDAHTTYNYWFFDDEINENMLQIGSIGYDRTNKSLVIKRGLDKNGSNLTQPDGAVYNFVNKSWYFTHKGFAGIGKANNSGVASNFINDKDGNLIMYLKNDNGTDVSNIGAEINHIVKWNNSARDDKSWLSQNGVTSTSIINNNAFYFTTKDFTFGDVSRRKKVYKVYVTYKSVDADNSSLNSLILVKYGINGGATSNTFSDDSTNYAASTGLVGSADWAVAELIPTSAINNIYSFQLQFSPAGGSTSNFATGFEINDISIIYRDKQVK